MKVMSGTNPLDSGDYPGKPDATDEDKQDSSDSPSSTPPDGGWMIPVMGALAIGAAGVVLATLFYKRKRAAFVERSPD
jgi:hypothetical protein